MTAVAGRAVIPEAEAQRRLSGVHDHDVPDYDAVVVDCSQANGTAESLDATLTLIAENFRAIIEPAGLAQRI